MNSRIFVLIGLCTVIGVLVSLQLANAIGQQLFAIFVMAAMILAVAGLYILFKREKATNKDDREASPGNSQYTTKSKYVWTGLLALWVIFCFWMTKGQPWLPRLIGASVLVSYFVLRMKRKRAKNVEA